MPEPEFTADEIDELQVALDITNLTDRQQKLFIRIFAAAKHLAIQELEAEAQPMLVRLRKQFTNTFIPGGGGSEVVVFAAKIKPPPKIRP